MSSQNNGRNLENLLNSVSEKLGKSPEELKKATQSGNIENLLGGLNQNDAQKIQKVLSDKNVANKLLASSQAQSLIKKLLGDNSK